MPVSDLLVPTNLNGHYRFQSPPKGFRPHEASDAELHRFGLPHRPDPKRTPALARKWHRAMRSVRTFVAPHLIHRKEIRAAPFPQFWSGISISDSSPNYLGATGTWVVPAPAVPSPLAPQTPPNSPFTVCIWTGLGDLPPSNLQDTTTPVNLLQAGTFWGQYGNNVPFLNAFWTWDNPNAGVVLLDGANTNTAQNFPVSAGDEISVWVSGLDIPGSANGGIVAFVNMTTGVATTPIVPRPPAGITNTSGAAAYWIIERTPNIQQILAGPGAGSVSVVLTELGNYSNCWMTEAIALVSQPGSAKTEQIAAGSDNNAVSLTMLADDNVSTISKVTVETVLHFSYGPGTESP